MESVFDLPDDPFARLWSLRRWEDLIPLTRAARAAARREADLGGEAQQLETLSTLLGETGRPTDAVRAARRAVLLRSRLSDLPAMAGALSALARALEQAGRHREALASHREAIAVHRQLGDTFEVCTRLERLGDLLRALGRWEEALPAYLEALPLAPGECAWACRSSILRNLAQVRQALGDLPGAIRDLGEAIRAQLAERPVDMEDLVTLANLHLELGQPWQARELLKEAETGLRERGQAEAADQVAARVHRLDPRSTRLRRRLHDPRSGFHMA